MDATAGSITTIDRSTAKSIASRSLLELSCGLAGLTTAGLGLVGYHPRFMAAVATLAFGLALIARSRALASRWPRPEHRELAGIGSDVFGALVCIGLAAITILTAFPSIVLTLPALVLGGLLMTDAPTQGQLVGASFDDDDAVPMVMSASGFAAIALSFVALLVMPATLLILLAMSCVGLGHVVATLPAVKLYEERTR